jgi:hypothetical protein
VTTDTSAAAVERLAAAWDESAEHFGLNNEHAAFCRRSEAVLRALVAERVALRQERDVALTDARDFERQSEIAYAERDAARAEAARLREALEGMLGAFDAWLDSCGTPDSSKTNALCRRLSDNHTAARAALTAAAKEAGLDAATLRIIADELEERGYGSRPVRGLRALAGIIDEG